jgi:hypothetical protein
VPDTEEKDRQAFEGEGFYRPDGSHDDLGISPEDRQKETDDLESLYRSEAAPESGQTRTRSDANELNKLGAGNDNPVEGPSEEGFYNPDKDAAPRKGKFWTRRKAVGGGIAGLIIGGTFGAFTILQGPLQFIHISQLLQRFHFASIEDNGNSRIMKQYKWIKNARSGTLENTRLGKIGSRVATKMDVQLADIGISKSYDRFGNYNGTIFDAQKYSLTHEDFCRGCGPDEFIAQMEAENGIKLKPQGKEGSGLFLADDQSGVFDFLAKFKTRRLNKQILADVGQDGVSGSIVTRIMGKRDAVTWHPIRRLDAKLVGSFDEKLAAWVAKLKQYFSRGEGTTPTVTQPTDKDGNPIDPTDPAAGDTAELANDAKNSLDETGKINPEKSTGPIKNITESAAGKTALTVTAIVGISCAIKGIANEADGLKHDMVVLPLIRKGVQAVSLGNQVMTGQDLDLQQLGFFAQELNDPDKGSWAAARSIQAELGQEQTGPDMPDAANPAKIQNKNMFSNVLDAIPGLGTICAVNNSVLGQAFNWAVSLTTPIVTASTMAITSTSLFKDGISWVVRWLAGSPLPTLAFGPDYGNFINYGARLASNDAKLALGGKKLSNEESLALRNYRLSNEQQEFAAQPFTKRIFDPYSPDSLVSKAIDNSSMNVSSNLASMFSSILNPFKNLAAITAPLTTRAKAATPASYDYGFQEIGFSLKELQSADYENPYSNGEAAVATLNIPCEIVDEHGNTIPNRPCGQDYINLASRCFGVALSPDGTVDSGLNAQVDSLSKDYDNIQEYGIHCNGNRSPDGLADPDPRWAQIRFYILDMKTAESTDCYLNNISESCQQVGF